MAEKQFKSFDEYKAEAEVEPWQLPIKGEDPIVVENPSGMQIMRFSEGYRKGDVALSLYALTGDAWERLSKVLENLPFKAMNNMLIDMQLHFDLMPELELTGPGGGTVVESDPRKIEALRKKGYKAAGEA